MLTAVIHISDIHFLHDTDTDGVYIENEEILEIGSFLSFYFILCKKPVSTGINQ